MPSCVRDVPPPTPARPGPGPERALHAAAAVGLLRRPRTRGRGAGPPAGAGAGGLDGPARRTPRIPAPPPRVREAHAALAVARVSGRGAVTGACHVRSGTRNSNFEAAALGSAADLTAELYYCSLSCGLLVTFWSLQVGVDQGLYLPPYEPLPAPDGGRLARASGRKAKRVGACGVGLGAHRPRGAAVRRTGVPLKRQTYAPRSKPCTVPSLRSLRDAPLPKAVGQGVLRLLNCSPFHVCPPSRDAPLCADWELGRHGHESNANSVSPPRK